MLIQQGTLLRKSSCLIKLG